MTQIDRLKSEVKQAILALDLIASASHPVMGFGDGYKQIGINFRLEACEMAAEITGRDRTFCKMLNHDFRSAACELMFERALAEVQ